MRRFLFLLGLLLAVWSASPAEAAAKGRAAHRAPLILISIDGFRPDYLDRGITPNLSRLASEGVRGSMHPSYPSLTFPNHYTLVTGLRPDHHGMVDNTFDDKAIDPERTFGMSKTDMVGDRRWWDEAEPIWVTAQKQGLTTATMFWPGSEADIHGVRPAQWLPFKHAMTSAERVSTFLKWLDVPKSKWPAFMTLYFDAVDTAGHDGGPGSAEVNGAVAEVDAAIGQLLAGLKARGAADANIVIVADHGMADIGADRIVYLDDLTPREGFRTVTAGSGSLIQPAPGHEAEVTAALVGPHDHFACWKKGEMPARFHYGSNPRIPPIVCLSQTGWQLSTRDWKGRTKGGAHGFDPADLQMQAVFIASGPAFARHRALPVFDNVDVYPLLARVLGIRALKSDGDLSEVSAALR